MTAWKEYWYVAVSTDRFMLQIGNGEIRKSQAVGNWEATCLNMLAKEQLSISTVLEYARPPRK